MDIAGKKADVAEDRWMSVQKAAAELACSRQGVLVAIAKGELVSAHVAERVVISRESVDALIATRAETDGRVA